MPDVPAGVTDADRSQTLWFALLLTFSNGFIDAYTYYLRGGVFANVQTGNVIFMALDASEAHIRSAATHLWAILAFVAGNLVAAHLKAGRADPYLPHPLRWAIGVQAVALAVIGFVPVTVPHSYVTVPISFLAAVQVGLFQSIGDLAYLPVATTGNLIKFVQQGYSGFIEGRPAGRAAFWVYARVITGFASGAFAGGFVSRALGAPAIWVAAGILAVIVVLFVIDDHRRPSA